MRSDITAPGSWGGGERKNVGRKEEGIIRVSVEEQNRLNAVGGSLPFISCCEGVASRGEKKGRA